MSVIIVFLWKIIFERNKIDLLGQTGQFSPDFFLQIGPERAKYGWFKQFKLDYQFSTKK